MSKKSFVIICSVLLGVMFAVHAFAYVYSGYKWRVDSITYNINNTWANMYGATSITSAALAWNQAGGAFSFVYGGLTSRNPNTFNYVADGYNDIGYFDAGNTGEIAKMNGKEFPGTTDIQEADITFNTNASNPFSNSGEAGKYDIQSVATHEFGHWLQLLHPSQLNCLGGPSINPTMCSSIGLGETWYQTLEQDDINGIKFIYPYHTVSGTISQNTTWYQNRVYVIQGAVTVNSGVTLTIEPGVMVKFQNTSSSLNVNGILNANGTSQSKIYFTSLKDDTVGGDTNGDGSATTPSAQNWDHIQFNSGSQGNLNYVVMRYAGANYPNHGIEQKGGTLTFSNSQISYSSEGIFQDSGTSTITSSEFNNNDKGLTLVGGTLSVSQSSTIHDNIYHGFFIGGGTLNVSDSAIRDNAQYGIYSWGGTITLINNIFKNNPSGAGYIKGLVNFTHSGNTTQQPSTGKNGFVVYDNINADRTWTTDGLPYIVSYLTVDALKTLTIDPGAIVKFESDGSYLDINGTLSAQGIAQNKIYFTSIKDDSVGGDTNGDGAISSPAASNWAQIKFNSSSVGNISNAVIRYGGYYSYWNNHYGNGIYNYAGTLTISDSQFTSNNYQGIRQDGGSLTLTNTEINNHTNYGLNLTGGTANILNSNFYDNTYYGVYSANSPTLTLTSNIFSNNSSAAANISVSSNFTHSGNTASGTGLRGFVMYGNVNANQTWTAGDIPYIVSSVTVDVTKTLTINPGAIIKFQNIGSYLDINGAINITGASQNKIYFTSIKDDTVGGDTNGDGSASSPATQNWDHLQFNSGSQGTLDNVIIRYAGANYPEHGIEQKGGTITISNSQIAYSNEGLFQDNGSSTITLTEFNNNAKYGITFVGGTMNVSQSDLHDNSYHGIYAGGGTLTVSNSTIHDNSQYGVYAPGGALTLTNNTFTNNFSAVASISPNIPSFIHSGNTATGTGNKGFRIEGTLNTNQTWAAGDLPYIIPYLSVSAGKTLTIDPGAIVKFDNTSSYIDISGTINATSADPNNKIYFTSLKDDSVGGDTNGDGSATTPAASDWQYIKFYTGSTGTLSNAVVRYGGYYYGKGIDNSGGTLNLTNSQVSSNNFYGISQSSGSATITSTEISNHSYYGVYVTSGALTLTNNTFSNNSFYPAHISASVLFAHSGNTASGTGKRGFRIEGTMNTDQTWTSGDLPYIVSYLMVNTAKTLILDPGVIVKFENSGSFDVSGTLQVNGLSANKIYFTSLKDDTIGGDTNGDGSATTPSAQDWDHLQFNPGSTGTLDNVILKYAGAGYPNHGIEQLGGNVLINNSQIVSSNEGIYQSSGSSTIILTELNNNATKGITFVGGTMNVQQGDIHHNSQGIYFGGGTLTVSQNTIHDNSSYGIYNATTNLINVENNYWGSASGPYHPTLNPSGTGNQVSDNVDFTPWLTSWP